MNLDPTDNPELETELDASARNPDLELHTIAAPEELREQRLTHLQEWSQEYFALEASGYARTGEDIAAFKNRVGSLTSELSQFDDYPQVEINSVLINSMVTLLARERLEELAFVLDGYDLPLEVLEDSKLRNVARHVLTWKVQDGESEFVEEIADRIFLEEGVNTLLDSTEYKKTVLTAVSRYIEEGNYTGLNRFLDSKVSIDPKTLGRMLNKHTADLVEATQISRLADLFESKPASVAMLKKNWPDVKRIALETAAFLIQEELDSGTSMALLLQQREEVKRLVAACHMCGLVEQSEASPKKKALYDEIINDTRNTLKLL